ncbi:MAG: hypothetical protein E7354_01885 [Clostridiales bacterium]|nr:hypothetical protein [Clostridiales bacterium]
MEEKEYERITQLLDEAYKTVRMGSYAIDCIIDKIEDKDLEDLIRKQNTYYLESTKSLESISKEYKHHLTDINPMLKGTSFASINMKTMFNKDSSHLAQMLIDGTTMGITTIIKHRNENNSLDKNLLGIVDKIISYLEDFVESLKEFL